MLENRQEDLLVVDTVGNLFWQSQYDSAQGLECWSPLTSQRKSAHVPCAKCYGPFWISTRLAHHSFQEKSKQRTPTPWISSRGGVSVTGSKKKIPLCQSQGGPGPARQAQWSLHFVHNLCLVWPLSWPFECHAVKYVLLQEGSLADCILFISLNCRSKLKAWNFGIILDFVPVLLCCTIQTIDCIRVLWSNDIFIELRSIK